MPDVLDFFPHLESWETLQLQSRLNELKGEPGRDRTDDELKELVCISRILKRRASTATKRSPSSPRAPKGPPSIDIF